jgi:hypothetical protein
VPTQLWSKPPTAYTSPLNLTHRSPAGLLVASCSKFPDVTVVLQAADGKTNDFGTEVSWFNVRLLYCCLVVVFGDRWQVTGDRWQVTGMCGIVPSPASSLPCSHLRAEFRPRVVSVFGMWGCNFVALRGCLPFCPVRKGLMLEDVWSYLCRIHTEQRTWEATDIHEAEMLRLS